MDGAAGSLVKNDDILSAAVSRSTPTVDVDAVLAQIAQSRATDERIRIVDRDDRARDAGRGHKRRARAGATGMRRTARACNTTLHPARALRPLRGRTTSACGPPATRWAPRPTITPPAVDDERADHRIRAGRPPPALRKRQGFAHEVVVVIHGRRELATAECRVPIDGLAIADWRLKWRLAIDPIANLQSSIRQSPLCILQSAIRYHFSSKSALT